MDLFILGGALGVAYTMLTFSEKDVEELGAWVCIVVLIFIAITSWAGLISAIASDINSIKKSINSKQPKSK